MNPSKNQTYIGTDAIVLRTDLMPEREIAKMWRAVKPTEPGDVLGGVIVSGVVTNILGADTKARLRILVRRLFIIPGLVEWAMDFLPEVGMAPIWIPVADERPIYIRRVSLDSPQDGLLVLETLVTMTLVWNRTIAPTAMALRQS